MTLRDLAKTAVKRMTPKQRALYEDILRIRNSFHEPVDVNALVREVRGGAMEPKAKIVVRRWYADWWEGVIVPTTGPKVMRGAVCNARENRRLSKHRMILAAKRLSAITGLEVVVEE